VTQAPCEQTSLIDPQSLQLFPPIPHALVAAPPTHAPLASQQPEHVPGPHGCAKHAPFVQEAPLVAQFWHAPPPVPHAVLCPPRPHTPPWQHPLQVTGPQVASHEPFTHWVPEPHAWHWLPATPHALTPVPPTHSFPAQHPEQFDGPHAAPT
jgi:hypothetical protein